MSCYDCRKELRKNVKKEKGSLRMLDLAKLLTWNRVHRNEGSSCLAYA
jgi:hypothetical protein